MSQQGKNDASIDAASTVNTITTVHNVPLQAHTPAGAAWCRKYLHPPAPTPADYAGVPDINNSPSVRTEYRAVQDIQTYIVGGGGVVTNFNKVVFLQMPSCTIPTIPFKYSTAGVLTQQPEDVVHNQGIDAVSQLQNFSSGRLSYKSVTYTLNSTDFNNQGVVSVAQFRPNVLTFTGDATLLEYMTKKCGRSKALEQLGMIRSKFPSDDDFITVSTERKNKRVEAPSETAVNFYIVLTVGKIPVNSTDVAQMSPNATVGPAKEGAFVVQNFSQPINRYVDYSIAYHASTLPTNAAVQPQSVCLEIINSDGTYSFMALTDGYNPLGAFMPDVALFDFTCAWVHFEGLSVLPAGSPTTTTPPYITVKAITGYEAQAMPNSVFTPFMANSAIPDSLAIDFAGMTSHARLDSLPARYNTFGAIASSLLAAAPSIISTLKGVFGKKETKEESARTKSTIAGLAAKLEAMRTAISQKRAPVRAPARVKPRVAPQIRRTPPVAPRATRSKRPRPNGGNDARSSAQNPFRNPR